MANTYDHQVKSENSELDLHKQRNDIISFLNHMTPLSSQAKLLVNLFNYIILINQHTRHNYKLGPGCK